MTDTTRKLFSKQAKGTSNWHSDVNDNFDEIDKCFGIQAKSVTNADVTLTADEARSEIQVTSGTMTANRSYIVPTLEAKYCIVNSCAGGFDLTVKTAAGTGVICPTGCATWVYCDGTNVVAAPVNDFKDLTSLSSIAIGDMFAIYDLSAKTYKSITPDQILEIINGLTEDTSPDATADYVVTYDNSAGTAKKVLARRLALECLIIAVSDETTAITTGTSKVTFRMPFAMTLTDVRASLSTASSSGTPTVDINEAGSTILTTKLTIDANEKTSTTAATPAVIGGAGPALADDAEMTIDIDVAGTGAKGLKVYLIGRRT